MTKELIVQAPSAACGQDGDLKNFDGESESNHTALLISILQVSSDNQTSVSEIADPGNPLQQVNRRLNEEMNLRVANRSK